MTNQLLDLALDSACNGKTSSVRKIGRFYVVDAIRNTDLEDVYGTLADIASFRRNASLSRAMEWYDVHDTLDAIIEEKEIQWESDNGIPYIPF